MRHRCDLFHPFPSTRAYTAMARTSTQRPSVQFARDAMFNFKYAENFNNKPKSAIIACCYSTHEHFTGDTGTSPVATDHHGSTGLYLLYLLELELGYSVLHPLPQGLQGITKLGQSLPEVGTFPLVPHGIAHVVTHVGNGCFGSIGLLP